MIYEDKSSFGYSKANFFSKLFFCWITSFFTKNYGKYFNENDLYDCPKQDNSEILGKVLEKNWMKEQKRVKNGNKVSLLRTILKTYGMEYMFITLWSLLLNCVIRPALPITLGLLILSLKEYQIASENQENMSLNTSQVRVYALAAIFSSILLITNIIFHTNTFAAYQKAIQLRIATTHLIYKKALKLSNKAMRTTNLGQIVNLISNDVNRLEVGLTYAHFLIVGPINMIVITYLLWTQIGVNCLAGILVLIVFIPMQGFIAKFLAKFRAKTSVLTDERIKLMNEILTAMRVIKMYVWEIPFSKLVELVRIREISSLRRSVFLRSIFSAILTISSKLMSYLCLIIVVISGEDLSAEKVFLIISLIDILQDVVFNSFSAAIAFFSEALISVNRIQIYLLLEEIEELHDWKAFYTNKPINDQIVSTFIDNEKMISVSIKDLKFNWKSSDEKEAKSLTDITFEVQSGELLVIIGSVGSGKTSVLLSILNELEMSSGEIRVCGKIAYVSQESWIFSGTVRENILFGRNFDENMYKQVIHVSALEEDIKRFSFGDNTVVGERGVVLSGGQKARVNLARALYSDADCYLLDDPLSAVDSAVAKHIFEKCIKGFLKNKCIILVTHQLQFIKDAKQIIVLKNGKCLAIGNYNELIDSGIDLIEYAGNTELKTQEFENNFKNKSLFPEEVKNLTKNKKETESQNIRENHINESVTNQMSAFKLIWIYLKSGSNLILLTLLSILLLMKIILFSGNDFWISKWTQYNENINNRDCDPNTTLYKSILIQTDQYNNLIIYSSLIFSLFIISLLRTLLFYEICLRASIHLHNKLFATVIRAQISFFDNNPIGILLNRFSRDMNIIDDIIPHSAYLTSDILLTCIMIAILCIYIDIWISIPTFVLLLIFLLIRNYFNETAKKLKKVEAISRSPILSHLSNSLHGLTTIRSSGVQTEFIQKFASLQDIHTSAYFLFVSSNQWFILILDLLCSVFIIAIIISSIININERTGSDVGLSISQALLASATLRRGIKQLAELESQLTSVERVVEFSDIQKESDFGVKPAKDWPTKGEIEFKNVSLRYNSSDSLVLNDLNFNINGGEKIGIVGRTGAGKSSIIVTLFRLNQPTGLITIDGINTSSISLSNLRKSISIIPQEPILFTESVRKNLDPFGERSDQTLWNVLEKVQLKAVINSFPQKLDQRISESGGDFSVGQKQLICLARAILRNNKILVLDEATANVDHMTDSIIQKTIRCEFSDCTVITIAHRINTIMDCDRVLVLDSGRIVQYDSPHSLSQQNNGIFSQMLETSGHSMNTLSKDILLQTYFGKLGLIIDKLDDKTVTRL